VALFVALLLAKSASSHPDQKGQNEKDKKAHGEQLATGMRGRRKAKAVVHVSLISGISPGYDSHATCRERPVNVRSHKSSEYFLSPVACCNMWPMKSELSIR
jgi:hypothetical protein